LSSSPASTSPSPSLPCSTLEFATVLSYIPRSGGGSVGDQSRDLMRALKDGKLYGVPPAPIGAFVAGYINRHRESPDSVLRFFGPSSVLVPVPRTSLYQAGSLWVPDLLAKELVAAGLGGRTARLLQRTEAIHKAATSIPSERPTALDHFRTLVVQSDLLPVPEVLLVDDVITRGDSILGSANRIMASYPGVPVRGFAAMRTVSNPEDFNAIVAPTTGVIRLQTDGHCLRRP
jgi:hypothetical protein